MPNPPLRKPRPIGLQSLIELPLLEALENRGGAARPSEIYDEIAERLNLACDAREETRTGGDQTYRVFDQQVRWTRQTLVARELVAGKRGIWELTDEGRDRLVRARSGRVVLFYSIDNGLAFLGRAEDAAQIIAPGSLDLILTSPPYPVVKRSYGRFSVPEWLSWMSELVGMWKSLLTDDGTLAVNLMDVFEPGTAMLSPYVERFIIDAIDTHGLNLAGRMPWHSPTKLANLEWTVKRKQALRNTVEHVILMSKSPQPAWNVDRLPRDPYAARSSSQIAADQRRSGKSLRPGGYDINEACFQRNGEGRIPSNLIVAGGTGGGGTYAARCREEGLPIHPARFPEELPRRVILLATEPGGIVYDPMAGSGTTAKVAHSLGRRFITSEPVLEYVRGSALRFENDPSFTFA